MNKSLFVDVNVLQTVPSSNVNRDDNGSPKSCIYGGLTRSRVSSQSWKHAMRKYFEHEMDKEEVAVRTKYVADMLEEAFLQVNPEMSAAEAEKASAEVIKAVFTAKKGAEQKQSKKKGDVKTDAEIKMSAMTMLTHQQARELAKIQLYDESKGKAKADKMKAALKMYPSIDMALFGRMIASDPSLNFDAASQVAHAFSTHSVETEYDYFTAVDDLQKEDSAGAGHIGVTEFTSATLYRYANVNVMELFHGLGSKTPEAVRAFLKAFILSMPSGKQNSFANHTVPDCVYIVIRDDQPVSLAPAFEKAVINRGEGFEKESESKMVDYVQNTVCQFVDEPIAEYTVGLGLNELTASKPLMEVLNAVETKIAQLLSEGE